MNILLIEANAVMAGTLAQGLEHEGFTVQIATGSFYALTMLERQGADLILCGDRLEGVSVGELAEIVRSDAKLAGIRVISYGRSYADGAEAPKRTDLCLGLDDPGAILAEVCRYVHREARLTEPSAASGATTSRVGLVGTLAIFELQELLQLLGFSGETGRMVLEMPSAVGRIFFLGGKIVHAEYLELQGDTAVGGMLSDASTHQESHFRFERFDEAEMSSTPRTIYTTVAQLLLTISVGLDTSRRING